MDSEIKVEVWVPIKGYEKTHFVSSFGNVKVATRLVVYSNGAERKYDGRNVAPRKRGNYLLAGLCVGGVRKSFQIHRLVAIAFIPNPLNKPVVNHLDGNPKNNHVSNLEWATHKENSLHAARHGKMNGKNPKYRQKLTPQSINEIKILKNGGVSNFRISEIYGVSVTLITSILNGKVWKHQMNKQQN